MVGNERSEGDFMTKNDVKAELKKLANSQLARNLSQHIRNYEKRLSKLVRELDLKTHDVREQGMVRLKKLNAELKKTRTDLEKRVRSILNEEGKHLTQRLTNVVEKLSNLAKTESAKTAPLKKRCVKPKATSTPARPPSLTVEAPKTSPKVPDASQVNSAPDTSPSVG